MIYIYKEADMNVSMQFCDAECEVFLYSTKTEDHGYLDNATIQSFSACEVCNEITATILVIGDYCEDFIGNYDFLLDVCVQNIRGFEQCTTIEDCYQTLAKTLWENAKKAA